MKPAEPPLYPVGGVRPDSVIVSHGHLDHCGVVPNLMDIKPNIFMTPVTKDLASLLARDTMKIARAKGQAHKNIIVGHPCRGYYMLPVPQRIVFSI